MFPEENLASSIFVRDLPEGITAEKMEEAFSRFGPIKNGVQGVNLKQQKGKEDFAFVEFEEAAAMQAAIEGQVIIDGKTVCLTTAPFPVLSSTADFPVLQKTVHLESRWSQRWTGRAWSCTLEA